MNILLDTHIALWAIAELPHHHQDPFDRLLIAQAMTEPMRLMTHDTQIQKYGSMVLMVSLTGS